MGVNEARAPFPPPPRCFFPVLSFVAKHGCVTTRRVPHFSRWKFSETWRFTWSTWNFRYLGWWKHGNLVGGWTNPSEQYESKWESSPGSGENENLFQNHHLVMHPFTSGYCVLLLAFQAGQKWGKIGSSERFNFLRWLFLILYVDSSCELNELPDLSYQQWQRPTPSVFYGKQAQKQDFPFLLLEKLVGHRGWSGIIPWPSRFHGMQHLQPTANVCHKVTKADTQIRKSNPKNPSSLINQRFQKKNDLFSRLKIQGFGKE